MRFVLALGLVCTCGVVSAVGIPEIDTFRIVPQYPDPAAGASITRGAPELTYGRLVMWDGNTVYFQSLNVNATVGAVLKPSGTGYIGDPSFVSVGSNNVSVILGSTAGVIYRITNINAGADFVADTEIDVPTHATGTLLSDRYVLLDRVRDDLTGAEIVLVDIAVTPAVARAVLQKPAGSGTASIGYNAAAHRVYIMNPTTRELRYFTDGELTTAFTTSTPVDWATDGTPVGAIGQFLNGGVYGVAPDGALIIGGDENSAGTGGIQWVNPNTTPAEVLATLDPAGSGPAYVLVYNRRLDQVLGIDPSVSPPDGYASTTMLPAIPPDSPCSDFDEIDDEFTAFIEQFSPGATDLDGDTIADTAMLSLVEMYSCRVNETDALAFSTNTAYDDNGEAFAGETNAGALAEYARIIPLLLFMNDAMQDSVLALLSGASLPLSGTYTTVTCTETDDCLPLFVEDTVVSRGPVVAYEPYFASGDADGDNVTNLTEYENVVNMGGDDDDFAIAASSRQLDGTGGIDSGGSGGCFIATAAYGTPMAVEIGRLRVFRDNTLLRSGWGAAFVDAYYRISPAAAAWIADRPAARAVARIALVPAVNPIAWIPVALTLVVVALSMLSVSRRAAGAVQRK